VAYIVQSSTGLSQYLAINAGGPAGVPRQQQPGSRVITASTSGQQAYLTRTRQG